MKLYAIFKDGFHKGNERAINGHEAIKKYIIASGLPEFINDTDLLSRFTFKIAIKGIHYEEDLFHHKTEQYLEFHRTEILKR